MRRVAVLVASLAVLALGACGNNEPATQGTSTPTTQGSSTIAVTLKEWSVAPAQATAAAGAITFQVKNEGATHEHEFVVVKTSLAPNALPTNADGSVNESGAGITAIGEIEQFAVGKTETKTFDLTPGSYVLFCNVVEKEAMSDMAGQTAHYKLGMFATFTVT